MSEFERLPIDDVKKRFAKNFVNNIGLFMGVFLVFAVIVIMTTDIHLVSFQELASLGLDFFLLLFCSYFMYICCGDTGTKAGLAANIYNTTLEQFDSTKKKIIEGQMQSRLFEFCQHYVEEELRSIRTTILSVVGISYADYKEKYMAIGRKQRKALPLTKSQKKAIKRANREDPVKLTPEMIMRHGRTANRRSPLGVNPTEKKRMIFGMKFVQISLISVGMSMIALDVIVEPSWAIVASVALKLVTIIYNGFSGYIACYDNIVVYSVNFMNDQIDLMHQAIQYISTTTND